jgi:Chs5-Arf1p-binding protein BUD7/BCH1
MEEEYRMQKAQGDISPLASTNSINGKAKSSENSSTTVIHEDGTVTRNSIVSNSTTLAETSADDDASTRGVVSSSSAADVSSAGSSPDIGDSIPIPTIRISTDDGDLSPITQEPGVDGEAKRNGAMEMGDTLEKPVQAAAGEAADGAQEPPTPSSAQEPFSFSNKRLCERWLDNLFMVLYEVCPNLICVEDLPNIGTRIYVCGQYSELKWRILKRSTLLIARLVSNGRY